MNVTIIAIVILYMLLMLAIGFYSSKKINSNTDFMVAGRRLGPLLMAGTLAATEIGGGSSLGVVANSYGSWGASSAWYIIAMGIAFIILIPLAPKFRASEVKTVPEYFRRRYDKFSGGFSGIIMLMALIGLTAGQFKASASILEVMLGIDYTTSLIIVTVVITVYAVMGGLWSVTLTDFIQVFLIVIGMTIAIPFALKLAGGWTTVRQTVPADHFSLTKGIGGWGQIAGYVIMYVATFSVGQEAVSRYYAARDGKAAIQGSILAAIVNFVFAFIPVILGLCMLSLFNQGRLDASVIDALKTNTRYALPALAVVSMPAVVTGILFAGIISATMSSADSDLLGAGSIFSNDIYRVFLRKEATDKEVMLVTKITMVLVALFSLVTALYANNILTLLAFSFTLRAAGTFIPYVMGHFWKKSSSAGCISSVLLGSTVFFLMDKHLIPSIPKVNNIIPALAISLILFVVFSLLFPPKEERTSLVPEKE
ncbi:Na+/proline symporter [Sphaerochaeta pleomorpha str. Grapes]|uniref:Na+/proline symporter n=1 Tax=Sphaerochaeta pleomorpha (strain ATCC BAA-1885 / DSM 22778 / Grapes) TaxID=158190 RepID=G8QRD9_SPHPG|nr:sodium:solute symporter family protein [Sphaerochaeta pleomorpha]AEV28792.1 Na+/proline symporter [Sphaerochaeta pleomorpha str. Grapes]